MNLNVQNQQEWVSPLQWNNDGGSGERCQLFPLLLSWKRTGESHLWSFISELWKIPSDLRKLLDSDEVFLGGVLVRWAASSEPLAVAVVTAQQLLLAVTAEGPGSNGEHVRRTASLAAAHRRTRPRVKQEEAETRSDRKRWSFSLWSLRMKT